MPGSVVGDLDGEGGADDAGEDVLDGVQVASFETAEGQGVAHADHESAGRGAADEVGIAKPSFGTGSTEVR